jgi:hypothetical protein
MILVQIDLFLGCQAGDIAGVRHAAKEEMPIYHSLTTALHVSVMAHPYEVFQTLSRIARAHLEMVC